MIYRLRLGDGEVRLHVKELSEERSYSTGRGLRRVKAEATLYAEQDAAGIAALEAAIARDDPVEVVDEAGEARWFELHQRTLSYSNGYPDRDYVLELTEVEVLECQALLIDGRTFVPFGYSEKVDDVTGEIGEQLKALIIDAKVRLTEDELDWLWDRKGQREPDRYFPVVRQGVTDDPRRMRFGRILWDRKDGVRAHVVLVEETYDLDPRNWRPLLSRPDEEGMREQFLELQEQVDRLFEVLVSREVMTSEEVANLKMPDAAASWRRERSLYEVDDIDKWDR